MKVLLLMPPGRDCQRIVERVKSEGYAIIQARNEDQAYNIIKEHHLQVAVIDAEKSSQNLFKKIRRLDAKQYVYIFSLSSSPQALSQGEDAEALADECLLKPVEPDELIARLMIVNRYTQTLVDIRTKQKYTQPIRDPITGTFSRTTILELINAEMSRCKRFKKPFIVALLELDGAAEVLANHGMTIFNRAMAQVGFKIWATVRAYDLIGRWDESRFMLLLPETLISGALVVADRLQNNISSVPLNLPDNGQLKLSASISFVQCGQKKYSSRKEIIDSVEKLLESKDPEQSRKTIYSRDI